VLPPQEFTGASTTRISPDAVPSSPTRSLIRAQILDDNEAWDAPTRRVDGGSGTVPGPSGASATPGDSRPGTFPLSGGVQAGEKQPARETTDPEAYRAYLRGPFFWNKRTDEGLRRAVVEFEEAIRRDNGYARAYAGCQRATMIDRDPPR
jgi:hypothetical protein